MKKLLLLSAILFGINSLVYSQCVLSCSNYAVAAITPSLYPTGGNNAIPLFTPNTDDGYTPPVPIGFNFNYYCTTYSTVLIYTNGLIQFDIGVPSTFPSGYDAAQLIPNPSSPTILNGIVCFRMDDLDPGVGGTVTYTTIGVSPNQAFVVTYSNVPLFGNATLLYSGQIILHETTNMITIHTINSPQGTNLATQGIENQTGTLGLPTLSTRNQAFWGGSNDAYRFSPAYQPTPPTSLLGTTSLCQGAVGTYTTSQMPGAISYTYYYPPSWIGTGTTSAISATAGVSGQVSVAATYSCGTSTPITLSVTTIPAPVVSIVSATPAIFCSGASVTITPGGAATYTLFPGPMIGSGPFIDNPLVNTTYTLMGVNLSGCVSTNLSTSNITVKQTPTVTVNSGTICLGESFTILASGANQYTYSTAFPLVTPTLANVYNYSVTGTSTNGCVGNTAISTLTVYALPVVTAVPTKTAICAKESTSLTAGGAISYTWNTSATVAVISVSPVTLTSYTVTGMDNKGCVSTGVTSVKVNPCTGINETHLDVDLKFYPNPSQGVFNLQIGSNMHVSVFNSLGEIIYSNNFTEGIYSLDLRSFADGAYYIKASDGEKMRNHVLIKN